MDKRIIDMSKKYFSQAREDKKQALAQRTDKYCPHCKKVLPLDDFYPASASGLTAISGWCCKCYRDYAHENHVKRMARRGKS